MKRKLCCEDGCKSVSMFHSFTKKGRYYNKTCYQHHIKKYNLLTTKKSKVGRRNFNKCSICGWDKTTCDIHRIVSGKNGGEYTKMNVIIICPNFHRLIHRGLIKTIQPAP